MKKYSITIKGHQTSISLEEEFWEELKSISQKLNKSINQIITEIDTKHISKNLSSKIRLFILFELKKNI